MIIDALAQALAASAGALGLRGGETELGRGLPRSLGECLELYREHPHWPSRLTSTGLPLEFSLAIDGGGRPTLRLLFDLADHRFWLEGNYGRYLSAAAELTGATPERLNRLFSEHFDGGVPTTRSPLYHGVRWGRDDSRHTTLYLFIGGLARGEVERRFAGPLAIIDAGLAAAGGRRPERYHIAAYDLDEAAAIYRTKLYGWLEVDGGRLRDVLGEGGGVAAAEEVATHLVGEARDGHRDRSLLLQSSVAGQPPKCGYKVIFDGTAWGFDSCEMLDEVGVHLSRRFGVNLSALRIFLSAFADRGIFLLPSWLGLGHGTPAPTCTFYFVPVPEHEEAAHRVGGLRAKITHAVRRAVDYLFGQRSPDGSWSDGPHGDADVVTTARVAAALTEVPEALDQLKPTGHWLSGRLLEDATLRADPEAGPLSVLVLQRLGLNAPAGTVRVLLDSAGPPERIALVLQARLGARRCTAAQGDALLQKLLELERWSGGWSGESDDLLVTLRVVEALGAAMRQESWPGRTVAVGMAQRAAWCFSERAIAAEPSLMAIWLKGWVLSGHDLSRPSVRRAVARLLELQRPEGHWLATPFRRTSRIYLDPRCLTTVAFAAEALARLRDAVCETPVNRAVTWG